MYLASTILFSVIFFMFGYIASLVDSIEKDEKFSSDHIWKVSINVLTEAAHHIGNNDSLAVTVVLGLIAGGIALYVHASSRYKGAMKGESREIEALATASAVYNLGLAVLCQAVIVSIILGWVDYGSAWLQLSPILIIPAITGHLVCGALAGLRTVGPEKRQDQNQKLERQAGEYLIRLSDQRNSIEARWYSLYGFPLCVYLLLILFYFFYLGLLGYSLEATITSVAILALVEMFLLIFMIKAECYLHVFYPGNLIIRGLLWSIPSICVISISASFVLGIFPSDFAGFIIGNFFVMLMLFSAPIFILGKFPFVYFREIYFAQISAGRGGRWRTRAAGVCASFAVFHFIFESSKQRSLEKEMNRVVHDIARNYEWVSPVEDNREL